MIDKRGNMRMNIIAADDEKFALDDLMIEIRAAQPDCILHGFSTPKEVLEFAKENAVDAAFLDIEMRGMNGLVLTKNLKKLNPKINVIFVTGYSKYAVDAIAMRCSGYLLKPVSKKAIEAELHNLRNSVDHNKTHFRVQTFGGFELFVDDVPVSFGRAKAKEVLAYLINKKGMSASTRELAAVLWEDKEYDRTQQSYLQTVIAELLSTLKNAGAEEIIIKKRNSLSIDPNKLDCDYYNFQRGDVRAVNAYAGDYMANYSWAESTVGYLDQIIGVNN